MMNVAVKTFQHPPIAIGFALPSLYQIQWLVWTLLFSVIFSAFTLVYIKDTTRRLAGDLQTLQNNHQRLRSEWSQLLLEESTWSSRSRVELIAQERLGMITPPPKSIVMVSD